MSEEKICKSCGKSVGNDFKLCPYCGNKLEENAINEKVCKSCGKTIKSDFQLCPYCGSKTEEHNYNINNKYSEKSEKNGISCLLLLVFLGEFGAHRFYTRRITSAIVWLILSVIDLIFIAIYVGLSSSLFYYSTVSIIFLWIIRIFATPVSLCIFIWWINDLILIIGGKFKDSNGKYIKLND